MVNHEKLLITGAAGFIGFHLCKNLIKNGYDIVGIDNLNSYYDIGLKKDRINNLLEIPSTKTNFQFIKCDLANKIELEAIFKEYSPRSVINLAAQAGVRYSMKCPETYLNSNIVGFGNIMECCNKYNIEHFIFASSSSVYGNNKKIPFKESDKVDHPLSLYAATKRSNELIAHTYSHLYNLPTTGLRFFTVYGPWGRPDMSYFIFTSKILKGEPIEVFNNGEMMRDFTYIDDVVNSITKLIEKKPTKDSKQKYFQDDPSSSWAPFKIFNIGNSSPTNLIDFIQVIEKNVGKKAKKNMLPMQPGDVKVTYADTTLLKEWIGYSPKIKIEEGIEKFVNWYLKYQKLNLK